MNKRLDVIEKKQDSIVKKQDELMDLYGKNKDKIMSLENKFKNVENKNTDCSDLLVEINERKARSKCIIAFNMQESDKDIGADRMGDDKLLFINSLSDGSAIDPDTIKINRIGKKEINKTRPVKIELPSEEVVSKVLKMKPKDGSSIKYKADLSSNQRKRLRELNIELRERKDKGEENLFIKYIYGEPKIVKSNFQAARPAKKRT